MNEQEKLSFIKSVLGNCRYSRNTKEAEFYCPKCKHHKPKLSVNIETDIYHCWVCDKRGTLLSLMYEIQASGKHIAEYINKHKAKNIYVKKSLQNTYSIKLPTEYQALHNSRNSIICKKAFSYLQDRKVPDDFIVKYKLGYCVSGDFSGRIIIPSFDKNGNLNFFTGRDITGESKVPYLNDLKLPKGYKNTIIINELNIDFSKTVVLVEGYFDMFNSVANTIPLCGSTINRESLLFKTLVQNNSDVILALDPDAFYKKTLPTAQLMMSYGLTVRCADFRPYKDLGKMQKDEGLERIAKSRSLDETFLRRMKLKGLFND